MKKKLLVITMVAIILTFFIYFYTKNDNITIVSLGDGLSIGMTPYDIEGYSYNDYLKEDYIIKHKLNTYYEFGGTGITIKEMIYAIKNNETRTFKNKPVEIKRAIYEANILTISIGMDELFNLKITNELKKEFQHDFAELLSIIKTLNNNKVIVLSLYETPNHDALIINKINAIIRDLTLSNNFIFLDINNLIKKDYFLNYDSQYLSYEAHKVIYKEIKKYL